MMGEYGPLNMAPPLLYRAALRGRFGTCVRHGQGRILDALFVYLDGKPDPAALSALEAGYRGRPWVCLTDAWEDCVRTRFPGATVYCRAAMKPASRFRFPALRALPAGCRAAAMDEAAFGLHPFSHGANYASYGDFAREGSGAVVWRGGEIVAAASSFLSLDGEAELDVSKKPEHRNRGLAAACVEMMLRDCMARGIAVHWDAQNKASRHLAEKFGFALEAEYSVFWA